MKQFSFPKHKRLLNNRQFKTVLEKNLRFSDDLLTLFVARNDCGFPRLGVSVGKACGGAVARNRIKRLMREAFRQSQDRIPTDLDYVLMISPQRSKSSQKTPAAANYAGELTFEQVETSFLILVDAAVRNMAAGQ